MQVRGLRKNYGARRGASTVSLDVINGEVVACWGPNGAGQDDVVLHDRRLVRADAGSIRIDGQAIEHMPIHRRSRLGLSYLPQEASIFRKLTVAENVRAVLELQVDAQGRAAGARRDREAPDRAAEQLHRRFAARFAGAGAVGRRAPAGWRSRARWPRSRASSCWTSRSPASTRSR